MKTDKQSYVVVRNTCTDEPRILIDVTQDELMKELHEWEQCGDSSWEVYVLGARTRYGLKPATIVAQPEYAPPQAITS